MITLVPPRVLQLTLMCSKNWLITSFDVGDQGKELLRAVASFSALEDSSF